MRNKKYILSTILVLIVLLTACAQDPQLTKFKSDVEHFCNDIISLDSSINNIDSSSEEAVANLLDYLDEVEMEFKHFAELDFPKDYDYLEPIADEAESYMIEAVKSYHEAFKDDGYDETIGNYAKSNYERSMKRLQIILAFLHGEDPSSLLEE